MVSSIESHPQKQQIIDLILAGKSLRDIAGTVTPKVSIMALQRYKAGVIRPALSKAAALAKVLGNAPIQANEQLAADVTAVTSEALRAAPILAARENRLAALQDRHNRLNLVMYERADDMADAPGGKSGLLARKRKMIGAGPMAREVTEYELDTGLLSEFREHEKQVAIELGQWQEGTGTQVSIAIVCPATERAEPAWEGVTMDIANK